MIGYRSQLGCWCSTPHLCTLKSGGGEANWCLHSRYNLACDKTTCFYRYVSSTLNPFLTSGTEAKERWKLERGATADVGENLIQSVMICRTTSLKLQQLTWVTLSEVEELNVSKTRWHDQNMTLTELQRAQLTDLFTTQQRLVIAKFL